MNILLLTGLALASVCSVNSYGPPPSKTKHRTTTTTQAPEPDSSNLAGNSIYTSGSGIDQPTGCSGVGGGCVAQPQYPGGQTGLPSSGPYTPGTTATSESSGGSTYWWQGPNSPFNPNKPPGIAPSQPQISGQPPIPGQPQAPFQPQVPGQPPSPGLQQYPGSNQPLPSTPGSHQPGPVNPASNQPDYPHTGSSKPDSATPSKPIDISNNPFLSSALGISKPGGCGSSSTNGCGPQSQIPEGQPQYPSQQPGRPQYPGGTGKPNICAVGLGCGQPQYPVGQPSQPQYPAGQPSQPQYPGGQAGKPQYPGTSEGQSQYPGTSQGQPQYPVTTPGQPQYPSSSQSQSPFPGASQGQPLYPDRAKPQQPGSSPQYPGVPQGQQQYPGIAAGKPVSGSPQGGELSYPGSSPSQYPGSPQYPQYGSGSNNIPSGSKFPPPFPGAPGKSCNAPNHLCVSKSACNQGVLSQNGVPGRAGICNPASEVCCRIPTTPGQGSQAPPNVGYGNGHKPGTNGVPIGGSIYDSKPNYVTPSTNVQPYTGPLNTTPYPGCPAALKCVSISLCTAEGVMSDTPVYLTREQQESRVPLTDCMNPETNVVGKCCRDPNYKDPWPAGMMMENGPTGPDGFDDGQYHPPEQEGSNSFSHEAGLYYNVVSTTPKGHTIKKPLGNFNQKPTPFPTKPSVPVNSGRQPAPVYENPLPERGDTPSNEILPPQQGQPNTGYNQIAPGQSTPSKPSITIIPPQPGQSPIPGSGPGYQPQSPPYSNPLSPGQTYQPSGLVTSPNSGYPQGQTPLPNQPHQSTSGQITPGYQTSQSTSGKQGTPSTGNQPGQSAPGQPGGPTGYQPSPTSPEQPSGVPYTGHQLSQSTPRQPGAPITGHQHSQPGSLTPEYQPSQITSGQGVPTPSYHSGQSGLSSSSYQPSGQPNQITSSYQPTQPNLPNQPSKQSPGLYTPSGPASSQYPTDEGSYSTPSLSTYTPRGHQAGQPSPGFVPGQVAPGTSCGIRHQAFSNYPDEAGVVEFPWQVLITSAGDKKFLCGGAIISEKAVITAAHCVENFRAKDLVIKAGVWKLLAVNEAEQTRPVAAIARHPHYDAGSLAEDLAILVVSVSFTPTEHVDKICLPKSTGYQPQTNNCVVTGWGRQALKGPIPNSILHKVDVSFMDNVKCEETLRATHLGKYFILNKGFSCALPKSSSDLCKVDIGGPLACDRGDGHYELAGINSWDVGCPAEQTPTVFSNPDAEWIQTIVNTPTNKLEEDEEKYNADKLKGESLDQVDIDQKPGFALGYGK